MSIGTGPALAVNDQETGERFYRWDNRIVGRPELNAATEDFPSVTTILGMLNKPALPRWAAKVVAEYAVQTREAWVPLLENSKGVKDLEATTSRIVKQLKDEPIKQRDTRGHRGTAIHELLDMSYGQGMTIDDAYRKLVGDTKFSGFRDAHLDEMVRPLAYFFKTRVRDMIFSEGTVYNTRQLYAGSFDAMVRMNDGSIAIMDYKTARGVYSSNALQLQAYSMCDKMAVPLKWGDPRLDGMDQENGPYVELQDLPIADYGLVIHLPGDQKATVYKVDFSAEQAVCVDSLRRLWSYDRKTRTGQWASDKLVYSTDGLDL